MPYIIRSTEDGNFAVGFTHRESLEWHTDSVHQTKEGAKERILYLQPRKSKYVYFFDSNEFKVGFFEHPKGIFQQVSRFFFRDDAATLVHNLN